MSIPAFIFTKLLPVVSWLLLIMSILLQFGAQKRMGIQRDLFIRNRVLKQTIFTPELVMLYKLLIMLVLLWLTLFLFRIIFRQNKENFSWFAVLTLFGSAFAFILLMFYGKISWLAYPWIVLASLFFVIIQLIRLIFCIIFNPCPDFLTLFKISGIASASSNSLSMHSRWKSDHSSNSPPRNCRKSVPSLFYFFARARTGSQGISRTLLSFLKNFFKQKCQHTEREQNQKAENKCPGTTYQHVTGIGINQRSRQLANPGGPKKLPKTH